MTEILMNMLQNGITLKGGASFIFMCVALMLSFIITLRLQKRAIFIELSNDNELAEGSTWLDLYLENGTTKEGFLEKITPTEIRFKPLDKEGDKFEGIMKIPILKFANMVKHILPTTSIRRQKSLEVKRPGEEYA